MRLRNALVDGDDGITQTVMPEGVSMREVITACSLQAELDEAPPRPCALLPDRVAALGHDLAAQGTRVRRRVQEHRLLVRFPRTLRGRDRPARDPDDEAPTSAELFHGGAEVGQGAHLAMRQMASEATGVALDDIHGHFSDTATSGDPGSASASRLTFMAGNSILGAAEEAEKA